jgi:hypothetical protein
MACSGTALPFTFLGTLITRSRLLKKSVERSASQELPIFIEPKSSLPRSQERVTSTYPELEEPNSQPETRFHYDLFQ